MRNESLSELKQLVPYVSIPEEFLYEMFIRVELTAGELVCDLGAGRWSPTDYKQRSFVPFVVHRYGAEYFGIEVNRIFVDELTQEIKRRNLTKICQVYEGDFTEERFWSNGNKPREPPIISSAQVVVIYTNPNVNRMLSPKLRRELKQRTRISSFQYPLVDYKSPLEEQIFWRSKLKDVYIDGRDAIFTYEI